MTLQRNRVTLRFKSDRGRDYLYDDETGSILPWSDLRESTLKHLIDGDFDTVRPKLAAEHGAEAVEETFQYLSHWGNDYGAFVRPWDPDQKEPVPPAPELREMIQSASFELLLILTENCNLRCSYCALSQIYPLNRVRTDQKMTFDTAKRAIDWYVELVQPQIDRNPRKRFGLSFYGGDALMNASVLRESLEYIRDEYPDTFLPVMTTNGTLLTPKNVEILVEHDVQLAISIDGPQDEHDRLRVDDRGRGSHERIMNNLRRIKKDHPEWFLKKLTSVSVYDWGTDVEAAERFFDENQDIIPRSVFVNQVGMRNTDYYDRFEKSDCDRMYAGMDRLRERYKRAKIEGNDVSSYMQSLVGMGIAMGLLRQRAGDKRPGWLPFTGTCLPGDKIAVHVDGKIDMCERVNGTYPIGHLNDGGIDYERLREIIAQYRERVMSVCHKCPATKHCSVCPALTEVDGDWEKVAALCGGTVIDARQRLADYVSIQEENPDADFMFDTDVSRLEQRMLFVY